jgi:hypothetical protein
MHTSGFLKLKTEAKNLGYDVRSRLLGARGDSSLPSVAQNDMHQNHPEKVIVAKKMEKEK